MSEIAREAEVSLSSPSCGLSEMRGGGRKGRSVFAGVTVKKAVRYREMTSVGLRLIWMYI